MTHLLGAKKDKPDPRDYRYGRVLAPVPVPPIVDHEPEMTPVRDQGQRSACVGFASCAVKEYADRRRLTKPVTDFDLSEEFVYEQVRGPGGGAYPRDAFKLMAKAGVCRESLLPYRTDITDATEPTWNPVKNRRALGNALNYKAQGYARITTLDELQQSLATNGPCMIGVTWLNGWFAPKEKIDGYPVLRPKQGTVAGGHALCVVGYDTARRLLKIKNSWGTSWGKSGYCLMSFDALGQTLQDAWALFDLTSPLVNAAGIKQAKLNRRSAGRARGRSRGIAVTSRPSVDPAKSRAGCPW